MLVPRMFIAPGGAAHVLCRVNGFMAFFVHMGVTRFIIDALLRYHKFESREQKLRPSFGHMFGMEIYTLARN